MNECGESLKVDIEHGETTWQQTLSEKRQVTCCGGVKWDMGKGNKPKIKDGRKQFLRNQNNGSGQWYR